MSERALLLEFAEWYGSAYAANFIPKGTIDAFLASREPQATERPIDTLLYHAARGEPSARDGWVWVLDPIDEPDAVPAALPTDVPVPAKKQW